MKYYKHNVVVSLKTPPNKNGGMQLLLRVSFAGKQLNLYSGMSLVVPQKAFNYLTFSIINNSNSRYFYEV